MLYKDLNFLVSGIQSAIGAQETKVQKKLVKIFEKVKPLVADYQERVNDARLENALTDEKGVLQLDEKGGYKFTKEGAKQLGKDIAALESTEIDFKPIEVTNPSGLGLLLFLKGWVSGVDFIEEEDEAL